MESVKMAEDEHEDDDSLPGSPAKKKAKPVKKKTESAKKRAESAKKKAESVKKKAKLGLSEQEVAPRWLSPRCQPVLNAHYYPYSAPPHSHPWSTQFILYKIRTI